MKKEDIPASTPEHRWSAPGTKGKLRALFQIWRKVKASEREAISKSASNAMANWVIRNSGAARSKRGGNENGPLFCLGLEPFRDLRHAHFRRLIAEAVEANDCAFFVRLGEALSRKPKTVSEIAPDNTVDGFLISNWWQRGQTPPLACLNPEPLATVVNHLFPAERFTADSIAKRVARLGLLTASVRFERVEKSDGGLLVS